MYDIKDQPCKKEENFFFGSLYSGGYAYISYIWLYAFHTTANLYNKNIVAGDGWEILIRVIDFILFIFLLYLV